MLKKLVITMLMGMMTLGAMAQGGKFTVKGTFEGRKDSVTLEIGDVNSWETIVKQTYAITGEMHELTCDLNDAALLYVTDVKGLTTVFPAIPGETLVFYQNEHKVTHLGGSQFYVDYDEFTHSKSGRCVAHCDNLPANVIEWTLEPDVFDCMLREDAE